MELRILGSVSEKLKGTFLEVFWSTFTMEIFYCDSQRGQGLIGEVTNNGFKACVIFDCKKYELLALNEAISLLMCHCSASSLCSTVNFPELWF